MNPPNLKHLGHRQRALIETLKKNPTWRLEVARSWPSRPGSSAIVKPDAEFFIHMKDVDDEVVSNLIMRGVLLHVPKTEEAGSQYGSNLVDGLAVPWYAEIYKLAEGV